MQSMYDHIMFKILCSWLWKSVGKSMYIIAVKVHNLWNLVQAKYYRRPYGIRKI